MLTLQAVAALVLLFVLLPVAKLTRRLVYTLIEQIDHGDVHEEGKSHLSRGMGALRSAGFVASSAWREAGREGRTGKTGSSGGRTPNRSNKSTGGSGRSQENGSVRSGYLPEKRSGVSFESERSHHPTTQNAEGSPASHSVRETSTITAPGKDGTRFPTFSSENDSGKAPSMRQDRSRPKGPYRNAAQKGSQIGGKWMGYTGAALSMVAGMGTAAAFGPLAGMSVASGGTKLFRRSGQLAGAATGMAVQSSRRLYEQVRKKTPRVQPNYHQAKQTVENMQQSYHDVKRNKTDSTPLRTTTSHEGYPSLKAGNSPTGFNKTNKTRQSDRWQSHERGRSQNHLLPPSSLPHVPPDR